MEKEGHWCTTRREFLLAGGGVVATVLLAPSLVFAEKPVALRVATYPRKGGVP